MTLRTKLEIVAAGALLIYLGVTAEINSVKKERESAQAEQRMVDALRKAKFAQGVAATRAEIIKSLPPSIAADVADVQKAEPSAAVASHASTTFVLTDTTPAKPTGVDPGAYSGPASIEDEYGRFHFDLPGGPLKRKQVFVFDGVVIKRLDGKHEFYKAELREYIPGKEPSKETEIPIEGVLAKSEFRFLEEQAPAPGLFHPIIVAAADLSGVGAGVEFFRYKRFSLSALGLYDHAAKTVRGSVQLGYRLRFPWLDTNLVVGASYSTDQKVRPSGTVQITR